MDDATFQIIAIAILVICVVMLVAVFWRRTAAALKHRARHRRHQERLKANPTEPVLKWQRPGAAPTAVPPETGGRREG